jgi:hypothetical protein
MTLRNRSARFLPLLLACAATAPLPAQQLIGYVNQRDAETTGASDVLDGQAVLTGSASVTAKDHTAPITLGRGGTVRVCQTSVLHLTESKTPVVPAPLLFSLDRGAIEIKTNGAPNDSIMTPDLRFSVHNAGPLDLRLRIARNGDTCVDNRGPGAPTLAVSDPFGEAMYEVPAGHHILFEHGSLHEVVDNETSPCGCPEEKGMSIADAMLTQPNTTPVPKPTPVAPQPAAPVPVPVAATVAVPVVTPAPVPVAAPAVQPAAPPARQATPSAAAPALVVAPVAVPVALPTAPVPVAPPTVSSVPPVVVSSAPPATAPPVIPEQAVEQAAAEAAARAAALHPFPTAISEGLAPPAEAPPSAPGAPPVQVAEALRYNAPVTPTTSTPANTPAAAPVSRSKKDAKAKPDQTAATQPTPPANDLVHVIGRFFKRLFGGH